MKLYDAIHGRRSIRKYKKEAIQDVDLDLVLEAAMYAPSAGNAKPWHFVVITDSTVLKTIPEFHPNGAMAANAPAAVLVCADLDEEKYAGNWMLDCSAATQNLMLSAHALGIGSVWTGIWPDRELVQVFKGKFQLPESVVPLCLVVMGYADEEPVPDVRKIPERIHKERW